MSIVVELSNGRRGAGRRLAVRALTGREEALVAEMRPSSPAAWGNAVLALAASELLSGAPVGLDAARKLSLGDRERLLLALYAETFSAADLVTRCQRCGEIVEIELDLTAFIAEGETGGAPSDVIEIAVADDGAPLRGRLPRAGDLEAIAPLAAVDPAVAAEALFDRCLSADDGSVGAMLAPERREALQAALARAVEAYDPHAEISVAMVCPHCAGAQNALLDAATLLRGRGLAGERIFDEVDRLARVYHWTEADILDMPRSRRLRYLALAVEGSA